MQFQGTAFRSVDELVNRLVAQWCCVIGEPEPAGDLLGRPAAGELFDFVPAQMLVPDQLAVALPASPGAVLGGERVSSRGTPARRGTGCG
jgi:hypothetical protein